MKPLSPPALRLVPPPADPPLLQWMRELARAEAMCPGWTRFLDELSESFYRSPEDAAS